MSLGGGGEVDGFQMMFCSYTATLPASSKVYFTSTCCCALPVLHAGVRRFRRQTQAELQPSAEHRAQCNNRVAVDVVAVLRVQIQRAVTHALANGPHVVKAGDVHAVRRDNLQREKES